MTHKTLRLQVRLGVHHLSRRKVAVKVIDKAKLSDAISHTLQTKSPPPPCPSQVRLGVHHLSRRKVAVKVIDKAKLSDANEAKRIQREIRVLKRLSNHECVIKLFEVVDAGSKLDLVMEYASGGSLLDYVRGRKRLGEAEAAYFLQQIVAGLMYCHDNEVRFFWGGEGEIQSAFVLLIRLPMLLHVDFATL